MGHIRRTSYGLGLRWSLGAVYALVYMLFALIVSITVMNMLVGVLVGIGEYSE